MEIINKTIYVSADGRNFETEEECTKWENRKFRKAPWHLTNSEIVGLMETAFETPFVTIPKGDSVGISLFIREMDMEYNTGSFDFRFVLDDHSDGYREYAGRIGGKPELTIKFSVNTDGNDDPTISKDWAYWAGVPIRRVFKYLESISFYEDQDKEPVINPDLKKEWTRIYYKNYAEKAHAFD